MHVTLPRETAKSEQRETTPTLAGEHRLAVHSGTGGTASQGDEVLWGLARLYGIDASPRQAGGGAQAR